MELPILVEDSAVATAGPDDGHLTGYFLLDRDARRRAVASRGVRSQLGYGVQIDTDGFSMTPRTRPASSSSTSPTRSEYSTSVLAGYGAERSLPPSGAGPALFDVTTAHCAQ